MDEREELKMLRRLAELEAKASSAPAPAAQSAVPQQAFDPSEGGTNFRPFGIDTGLQMPQGLSRFMAGAGKTMADLGRGAGQLVHDGLDAISPAEKNIQSTVSGKPNKSFADRIGLPNRTDIDEIQKRDAALVNTGAGTAGQIAGGVAMSLPALLAGPAAGTIGAQAGIGALQGALQPVGTDDSRARNIALGGALGGAVPLALRGGKVLKAAAIDPFTDAGREKIVGGAISRAASDKNAAMAKLLTARGATPGFLPTAGQAADDAGIASLERTARAIDPGGFGDIDQSQRAALVNALRGVAKAPEDRAAAVTARNQAVKPLYDAAKQTTVDSDNVIAELLKRPSMKTATGRAGDLAAERGEKFAINAGTPEQTISSGLLDAQGNPITQTIPAVAGKLQGNALHDLKMGLDDAIGSPGLGGMQGAERNAAIGTKDEFMGWLENKIPEYGQAKTMYADMSKPINQMDIGQELYNRFVPPLGDGMAVPFSSRASSYAQALRNGDKVAANVTGMKSATLDKIMEPEQMQALQGVLSDSQMKAAAETAGRGVGSDTVQKMAMSNLIEQAGLPSWIGALQPLRPLGGWAQTAGNLLYKSNDEKMRHLLADVLKDPANAAEAMKKANVKPSEYAKFLRTMGAATNQALPAAAVHED